MRKEVLEIDDHVRNGTWMACYCCKPDTDSPTWTSAYNRGRLCLPLPYLGDSRLLQHISPGALSPVSIHCAVHINHRSRCTESIWSLGALCENRHGEYFNKKKKKKKSWKHFRGRISLRCLSHWALIFDIETSTTILYPPRRYPADSRYHRTVLPSRARCLCSNSRRFGKESLQIPVPPRSFSALRCTGTHQDRRVVVCTTTPSHIWSDNAGESNPFNSHKGSQWYDHAKRWIRHLQQLIAIKTSNGPLWYDLACQRRWFTILSASWRST